MKYESLKNNRDFVRAYKKGNRFVSNLIVLYKIKNNLENKRIGITVSKKVGNAVTRNRVRRLIKESIYLNINNFEDGYDYVFVARIRSNSSDYHKILSNINYLVSKLKKKNK